MAQIETLGHEAFVWVGLHEPDEAHMKEVADVFGLHPLAVEDAVCAHQRPKLERYDDTLALVLKTIKYVPHESVALVREIVQSGEVMIFVGRNFVVTVRHGDQSGLADVRKRMEADGEQLRLGPFAVMHTIADYVVDHYLEVTRLMEADIYGMNFSLHAGTGLEVGLPGRDGPDDCYLPGVVFSIPPEQLALSFDQLG